MIFLVVLMFYVHQTYAQRSDLLNTPMKFFTLNQSRINTGLSVEIGAGSLLNFQGILPNQLTIESDSSLFGGLTLLCDVTSPKSRLNFHFGVGWDYLGVRFLENQTTPFEADLLQLHFPFYAKFTFGKKWADVNPVFFVGGAYNLPLGYWINDSKIGSDAISKYISLSTGLAIQANFRGKEREGLKEKIVNNRVVYVKDRTPPRIWLFLKVNYTPISGDFYNPSFTKNIISYYSSDNLNYKDYRISIGIANFWGENKKNSIR